MPWLEPLPDPESIRLAFVAALQHLSPRQRAVLVLRDVLQWRAREQLDAVGPSQDDQLSAPESPEARDQLARYISAFEDYDIERLVDMFTSEAVWEMPRSSAGIRVGRRHAAAAPDRQRPARRGDVHAPARDAFAIAERGVKPRFGSNCVPEVHAEHAEPRERVPRPPPGDIATTHC